jgi:hypothetical protein
MEIGFRAPSITASKTPRAPRRVALQVRRPRRSEINLISCAISSCRHRQARRPRSTPSSPSYPGPARPLCPPRMDPKARYSGCARAAPRPIIRNDYCVRTRSACRAFAVIGRGDYRAARRVRRSRFAASTSATSRARTRVRARPQNTTFPRSTPPDR